MATRCRRDDDPGRTRCRPHLSALCVAAPGERAKRWHPCWRCRPLGRKPEATLTGNTFGPIKISVPRARFEAGNGKTSEWKSKAAQGADRVDYLAGTNTRGVLATLFGGAAGHATFNSVLLCRFALSWRRHPPLPSAWRAPGDNRTEAEARGVQRIRPSVSAICSPSGVAGVGPRRLWEAAALCCVQDVGLLSAAILRFKRATRVSRSARCRRAMLWPPGGRDEEVLREPGVEQRQQLCFVQRWCGHAVTRPNGRRPASARRRAGARL
jgi:hypothetical protein